LSAAAVGRVAILWLFATGIGEAEVREPTTTRSITASA